MSIEPSPRSARSLRFLLPAALVVCGGSLLYVGVDMPLIQDRLQQIGPWAPIAFVFLGIALMSVLLPKTVVSLSAGAMFGLATGSLLMLLIATSAAILNYTIGRWWLGNTIQQRLDNQTKNGPAFWAHTARDLAAEAGLGFHLLIRLAPIPSMMVSYTMGAVGARVSPFMTAAAIGVLPQLLWVHGGSLAAIDQSANSLAWIGPSVSIAAAMAVSFVVPREALRRIRQRQAAMGN